MKNGLCLRPLLQRQNGFVSFESHERTLYNRVSRKEPREGTSRDGEHPSEATKGTSRDGEHQSEATKGTFHNGKYQSEATEGPPHNGKYQSEATEENLHKKYSNDSPWQRLRNEKIVVQLNKDPGERRIRNQKNRYIQIG